MLSTPGPLSSTPRQAAPAPPAACPQAVTTFAAAHASLSQLYPVAALLGLLFGSHWSLVPAICSDMFGGRTPLQAHARRCRLAVAHLLRRMAGAIGLRARRPCQVA